MRLGVLFSGGKDSCLAIVKALNNVNVSEKREVLCLINVDSQNKESYMFHTVNAEWTQLQAEAMGLPLEKIRTKGEKEKELIDLEKGLAHLKLKYKLDAVVSGAIASNYQFERIKRICDKLGLASITPLWHEDQIEELKDIIEEGLKVILVGVSAYPLDKNFLGKEINEKFIRDIKEIYEKVKLNVTGEGGEFETFVYDMPMFRKKIIIDDYDTYYKNYFGYLKIKKAHLINK